MTCRLFDRRIFILLFASYLAAVAVLCFMKPDGLPEVEKDFFGIPIDKVAHFIMFLPYPILAATSFIRSEMGIRQMTAILAVTAIVGVGLAYGTEVIQAQTGYRAYEIDDFKADLTGMVTGMLATVAGLIRLKTKR